MHEKRRQRGQPLQAPVEERLPPFEAVIVASNDLAEAEAEEEYRRAKDALRSACERWLVERGWIPPPSLRKGRARVKRAALPETLMLFGWRAARVRILRQSGGRCQVQHAIPAHTRAARR